VVPDADDRGVVTVVEADDQVRVAVAR